MGGRCVKGVRFLVTNAITLAFFDHYVVGTSSPLLEDPTARFPEVTFERRVQR